MDFATDNVNVCSAYGRFYNTMLLFLLLVKSKRSTWNSLWALLIPWFILSSASLSEMSIERICGTYILWHLFSLLQENFCLETLGIDRKSLMIFFSSSQKKNIYLQLRPIAKLQLRFMKRHVMSHKTAIELLCRSFYRDLGFLVYLITTEEKVQVFVKTKFLLNHTCKENKTGD